MPDAALPTRCLRINAANPAQLTALQTRLRELPIPVIARLHQDAIWLDMRGAEAIDELVQLFDESAA